MSRKIEDLVDMIMELDEVERIEFIAVMKGTVKEWKERNISELKWMEQLEEMGFKAEEEE